jgi:hypothetical protein
MVQIISSGAEIKSYISLPIEDSEATTEGSIPTATCTSVTGVTKRQASETSSLRGHGMKTRMSKQLPYISVGPGTIEASSGSVFVQTSCKRARLVEPGSLLRKLSGPWFVLLCRSKYSMRPGRVL